MNSRFGSTRTSRSFSVKPGTSAVTNSSFSVSAISTGIESVDSGALATSNGRNALKNLFQVSNTPSVSNGNILGHVGTGILISRGVMPTCPFMITPPYELFILNACVPSLSVIEVTVVCDEINGEGCDRRHGNLPQHTSTMARRSRER